MPEGTVLITDHQIAGRGQRGNSWEATAGMNLTFSVFLRPSFLGAQDQFQLNMAVSLAVADALQFALDSPIKLKWPNDIWVNENKIGGILIENQLQAASFSSAIVGIGVNINQERFSYPKASSLSLLSGEAHDLNDIFQRLMESLESEYLELRAGHGVQQKQRYLLSLYKFNELHRFESKGEDFMGSILDVDQSGRLCIESQGKTREFSHQEVKFLG